MLQPAVDYADQGFPITEEIASLWKMKNALPLQGCCTQMDPDSIKNFYVNGKQPPAGTIFRNPDLAKAFRLIQQQGRDAFYKGEIGRAIAADHDVIEIHDLHVWAVTSGFPALSAHLVVRRGANRDLVRSRVEALLEERFEIRHTTLQVVESSEHGLITVENLRRPESE